MGLKELAGEKQILRNYDRYNPIKLVGAKPGELAATVGRLSEIGMQLVLELDKYNSFIRKCLKTVRIFARQLFSH